MLNEMDKKLKKIIMMEDDSFYLYQFPIFIYIKYGNLAYDIVNIYKNNDNYMGIRESWKLIDSYDIKNNDVVEYGCNVGSTSYNILNMIPKKLYSFDISPKAIEFCKLFCNIYNNWYPKIRNMKNVKQSCDTSIWEDPHTASNEEWKKIVMNIIKNTKKIIYFLECDNIEHIIKPIFGQALIKIRNDSWKVIL